MSVADGGREAPEAWWAGGLATAERLPLTGLDGFAGAEGEPVLRRLASWRDSFGDDRAALGRRLTDLGVDETGLRAVFAARPAELASRGDRPAWSSLVAHAVCSAPRVARQDDAVPEDVEAFALPLRPFTDAVVARLRSCRSGQGIDLDAVAPALGDQLGRQLARMAARTMVLELHQARTRGALRGETSRERFADFVHSVSTRACLTAVFDEYPVLARLIGQTCEQAVVAHRELLDRFARDRAAIVERLLDGADPGDLVAVETGKGDGHDGGRTVAVLRFADGRAVVYKPRPVALHAHFGQLIDWLNGAVPELGLRSAAVLARAGYGWIEFIDHHDCADLAGVDRFYRRQGALLALLHALDAIDMHYENLIAHGDQPVIVDVETLFHPAFPVLPSTGADPAIRALSASVDRTALLPRMLFGDNGAVDVSGLGGDQGAMFPHDTVTWADAGTDTMHLVRGPAPFPGAANRPRLHGRVADPADHAAVLVAGFRRAYHAIVAHRAELIAPDGPLRRFADDDVRIVARNTQLYATLLDESTHPDALRDGLDRDRLLNLLWSEPIHDRLAGLTRFEAADLWSGDVPLFTCKPSSRDVWTASGQRLPGLLETTGMDSVAAKIAGLGEVDLSEQEWLISASLATKGSSVSHRGAATLPGPVAAAVADPQLLLSAACGIADQIAARAFHDKHRANWLTVENIDDRHWALLPMGAGLASGYTGVALFLAQLGAITGVGRYAELARKAIRPIPALLETLAEDAELARTVGSGGFAGLGGICYGLSRLGSLLDDTEVARWLELAVQVTATADDGQLGVADGRAGALAALTAVHQSTGLDSAGKLAAALADRVVADRATVAGTGFLRGSAGIGWALLRHARATGEQRHADAGRAALRDNDPADPGDLSWCGGAAGRAVAVAEAGTASAAHVRPLAGGAPLRDLSLCHGQLGVVEALTAMADAGDEQARAAAGRAGGLVLGVLDHYGPRCGTPGDVPTFGLLTGLAGIGFGLLRLGFAGEVPSALLLAAAPPGTREPHRQTK